MILIGGGKSSAFPSQHACNFMLWGTFLPAKALKECLLIIHHYKVYECLRYIYTSKSNVFHVINRLALIYDHKWHDLELITGRTIAQSFEPKVFCSVQKVAVTTTLPTNQHLAGWKFLQTPKNRYFKKHDKNHGIFSYIFPPTLFRQLFSRCTTEVYGISASFSNRRFADSSELQTCQSLGLWCPFGHGKHDKTRWDM